MKQRRILVVDDEPEIRRSLAGVLEDEGYLAGTAENGEACLDALPGAGFELVLLDIWLPGIDGMEVLERIQAIPFAERPEVVVISGHGSIEAAVKATKLGAFDFLEKPLSIDKISVVVKNALAHRALALENSQLKQDSTGRHRIIGESVPMKALRQQLSLMAATNGRVLIYGESGTGKELVAHAIHALSTRAAEPFVEVNCAAIPEELIESELFGHIKGSFTSAHEDKIGKFQKADGGTLFLDEVGDMSLRTQSKVLRSLEEQRFEPVGGPGSVQVDVRVVAATNKNLEEEIERGNFREDLFYRLNVVPIRMPALRQRPGDVPALALHFVEKICRQEEIPPKTIAPEAAERLCAQSWPGNVRQLENAIEMAVALSGDRDVLVPGDFPLPLQDRAAICARPGATPPLVPVPDDGLDYERTVALIERSILDQALRKTGGNKKAAADMLRLKRTTLSAKVRSLEPAACD